VDIVKIILNINIIEYITIHKTLFIQIVFFWVALIPFITKYIFQCRIIQIKYIKIWLPKIIFFLFIGIIIYELNIRVNFRFSAFINICFFGYLIWGLSISFSIFYFKEYKDYIIYNLKLFEKVNLLFFLILTANGSVSVFVFACFLVISYNNYVIIDLLETLNLEKNIEIGNQKKYLASDKAILNENELFEQRKNQLDILMYHFEDYDREYTSLYLNGEWGEGKTSLLNVLKQRLDNRDISYIYIDPNIDSDLISMLKQVKEQLEKIFEDKAIYAGKGSGIDRYIKVLLSILEDRGFEWLNSIFDYMGDERHLNVNDLRINL
jgi:hypothetical protein